MNPSIPPLLQERPFELITASAGTGKTYQLTTRLTALLLAGAAPRGIAALTFTRTAAGEFLDALLAKLARAATDPVRAAALAGDLGLPAPPPPEACRAALQRVVEDLPRLTFTTLDGFFHRLASSFCFELGLHGPFRLLDEAQALEARHRVRAALFTRLPPRSPLRRTLLDACRDAFGGDEKKDFSNILDEAFLSLHSLYRKCGSIEPWLPAALPEDLRACIRPPGDPAALHADFLQGLRDSNAPDKALDCWLEQGVETAAWSPGIKTNTPWKNILAAVDLASGACARITLNRAKIDPSPSLARAAHALTAHWLSLAVSLASRQTAGFGRLLELYEAAYDAQVRRQGALVFDDLAPLLTPNPRFSALQRQDLEYRLDSAYRHWLFDEFQDTSRAQWDVFHNLIEEVLSDPTRTRTFFCVGDPKQAIYGWRGGESRLMEEMQERFAGVLHTTPLDASQRSVTDVTHAVNSLLRPSALLRRSFPAAATAWEKLWRDHHSARPPELRGAAAFLRPLTSERSETEDARTAAVAAVLRTLPLREHGLSCAVLVQTNDEAARLVESLSPLVDLPVLLRARENPALDNSLGTAARALLRRLAHPADSLSAGWLAASPLGPRLAAPGVFDELRRTATARGFADALVPLLNGLVPPGDDFLSLRCRQLTDSLLAADHAGITDPDAAWRLLESSRLHPAEQAGCVEVMTIHQAKGLGFDAVIVTQLKYGNGMDQRRDAPYTGRQADGIPWILADFQKDLVRKLPGLAALDDRDRQEAALEKLCLLYVALTRARHGLYLVGDPPAKTPSDTVRWQTLIEDAWPPAEEPRTEEIDGFTIQWAHEEGRRDWWISRPAREDPRTTLPPLPESLDFPPPPRLPARTPSGAPTAPTPWRRDPGPGLRLHALLAAAGPDPAALLPQWQAALPSADGPERAALESALSLVQAPALREVFSPPPETEVWIERSFDAVLDGVWVTGRFDRVHVWRDQQGKPRAAALYDFKSSDPQASGNPRPAEQIRLYRRALAALTGLPPGCIPCALVIPGSPPVLRPID